MGTYRRLARVSGLIGAACFVAALSFQAAAAAATKLVVVLPGQTFVPGVGVTGTPNPVELRRPFRVEVYAVDAFGNVAFEYEGAIVGPGMSSSGGPLPAPLHRRFGTSISGAGATTSIPGGALRLSLGGGPFQEINVAPAAGPAAICQSIEAAVHAVPVEAFDYGDFDFRCRGTTPLAGAARFTLFLDDGKPVRSGKARTSSGSGGSLIAIDPAFGLAPSLHLGAPAPSSNPADPAEYAMPALVPPFAAAQRFSRGIAVFEVSAGDLSAVGSNRAITIDQGASPALPVEASTFEVTAPAFAVVGATALGDGQGRINRVRLAFSQPIVPASIGSASDLVIEAAGLPPVAGTELTVAATNEFGYPADQLEVTFGTGIGRTDVQDVEVRYTPPSSGALTGADTGAPLPPFAASSSTSPRLIDGAPPVLVNAFGEDTDGNGGPDRLKFFFSEPVAFGAGRALSLGGLFDPAVEPAAMTVPVPFDLRVRSTGLATFEDVVQVVDPGNPAATAITGADAIAEAVTAAVVRARPAYLNFTCTFVSGRYVLRAGIPAVTSGIEVLPSGTASDGAPALKLGPANGGVERPGFGDALVEMPADLCVRGQNGANLLLGKTEADLAISTNVITVSLTNVPGSGTGTPSFLWRDDGDLGFVTDRSSARLRLTPIDNIGLASLPHPAMLLREASSSVASDGSLVRGTATGDVTLDGSPSFPPLNARDPETVPAFRWVQVEGPFVAVPAHNNGVVTIRPSTPGVYVFELQVLTRSAADPPVYNPYTAADGSLARKLSLTVQPGPAVRSVVVLPGQFLLPGTDSVDEVVGGTALVQTEGTPFQAQVFLTDQFFNVVDGPPGASVQLTTSDPGDVEPPAQPFVAGTATFTLKPSHAATFMIPEIDDEVLVVFEHGDIHYPYVAGSLWAAQPLPRLPAAPYLARFTWNNDPRAVRWNIYRTSLHALTDLNHDGLPDPGYGTCVADADPFDLYFEDPDLPATGDGYMYSARESLVASGIVQAAGLGLATSGLVRPPPPVCP